MTSQDQHLFQSSKQCQDSQTIALVSTVTAQLSLLDCLPSILLTAENGKVFIQRLLIRKNNQLIDALLCVLMIH